MGWQLWNNLDQLADYNWEINYPLLIVSTILAIAISLMTAIAWSIMINCLAPQLDRQFYTLIWLKSVLAKYLPGGIWNLVSRVYLCQQADVSTPAIIGSILLETLLTLLAQITLMIILGTVYFAQFLSTDLMWLALTYVIGVGIIVHPNLFNKILQFLATWRGEAIPPPHVQYIWLVQWLGLYIGLYILGGLAFFLFIVSIYPLSSSCIPLIIAIVNFTFFISFITPLAPNGLGVREGLLALLLSYVMPFSIATIIALTTRIWLMMSEVITVTLGILIHDKVLEK